MSLSQGIK